jgi:hypothetical protein
MGDTEAGEGSMKFLITHCIKNVAFISDKLLAGC